MSSSSITAMARQLRGGSYPPTTTFQDEMPFSNQQQQFVPPPAAPVKPPPAAAPSSSDNGELIYSCIFAILTAMAMLIFNPTVSQDKMSACPKQSLTNVAAASLAVMIVSYVLMTSASA